MLIDYSDPTPWTWKEIAALNGPAYAEFLEAYGDRGKVAMVIAETVEDSRYCRYDRDHCTWGCGECPLWAPGGNEWLRPMENLRSCVENAPKAYARMVSKLGRLPG